jgi:phasin
MNENLATKERTAKSSSPSAMIEGAFEKSKMTAEQSTKVLEQAFGTASKGVKEFNLKLVDLMQTNAEAAFDFARQMTKVKTPSEFFEISAGYARKQFETFTEQTKELTTLAQKLAMDTSAPIQQAAGRVM